MKASTYHVPVLADAVARLAAGRVRAVDATAGGGGHTALLVDAGCRVLAVDRDPEALAAARNRLGGARVEWLEGRFGEPDVLEAVAAFEPDLVVLDLGVSSHQLDRDERGFSFRPGVPLDMRMDRRPDTESAADLLVHRSEAELAHIFHEYGDEPKARRLARAIVERRNQAPLRTSDDLVNAIRRALGPRSGPGDFARLFQAVRIAVNREAQQLGGALPSLRAALRPAGVLAVITYHSGEDRIVKNAFREWERTCVCPPGQPVCTCRGRAYGRRLFRRPLVPSASEIAANPRARSAKLRAFEATDGG